MSSYYFTSESVSEGHPDKIADLVGTDREEKDSDQEGEEKKKKGKETGNKAKTKKPDPTRKEKGKTRNKKKYLNYTCPRSKFTIPEGFRWGK